MSKITKNMTHTLYRSGRKIKHQMPAILSITAIVGVAATAVTAVRATPKALKLLEEAEELKNDKLTKVEVVVAAAPCYIPTAVIAASTIACILGAHVLNRKQQTSMAAAYAMLDRSYKQFRNKVSEIYGAESIDRIKTEMTKDDMAKADMPEEDDGKELFFDSYRKKYFRSTPFDVLNADHHFNRNFSLRGYAFLNEYYNFLGLDSVDFGDAMGWDRDYCYENQESEWLDFIYHKTVLDDGLECTIIDYFLEPTNLESYWEFGGC